MLLSLLLAACAPKLPPASGPEHPLLLWRVERAGKASHLMGTCHVGVPLDYALPQPHDEALLGARVVYTEASLDLDDPGKIIGLLWHDGPGLKEQLPEDRWRAVAYAVRDTIPAPLLEHMQPWAAALMVPMVVEAKVPTEITGMDQEIQKRAEAKGIPLAYVETLEGQAALLAQWNDTFLATLGPTDPPDGTEGEALTALCRRGDTRGAGVLYPEDDPTMDALLGARNRAWVPQLLPALAEGGAFVAVGAGHMLGADGLLALLQAEGYSVTQLTTTRPPSEEPMPSMAAHIPPAPPAPLGWEAQGRGIAERMADAMCAPGQLIPTCFEPDLAACRERLTEDGMLCVGQYADLLRGFPPDPSLDQRLMSCVPAGMVLEGLARDTVADAPVCNLMKTAMKLQSSKVK